MPALKQARNIYEYISGYVDGEGCFSISFSRREKFLVGWETKPSFSVSQNEDRAQILYLIQETFKCGHIRRDYGDKTLKYEVRSLNELLQRVVPHFEQYPLMSEKQKDFEKFKRVCVLMRQELHTHKDGLRNIISVAFTMNPSGKRKYTQAEMLAAMR